MANKRPRDDDAESVDLDLAEGKEPKVARTEEEPIKEEDIWPHDSRALSTLSVHVSVFNDDDDEKILEKRQTHLLHIHCIPGALVAHSKFFAEAIERDPTVTNITMPESFTWRALWSSTRGYVVPDANEVREVFHVLHGGKLGCVFEWSLVMMYHYLHCPVLCENVESNYDNDEYHDEWIQLAWADHFNCATIIKTVSKAIKANGDCWHLGNDLKKTVIEAISKQTLVKLCELL